MLLETIALNFVLPLLSLSVLMVFFRLFRGPSLVDRVVALDLLATIGISVVSVHALVTGQTVFLDVAILLALIAFLSTVAFAYYVERGVILRRQAEERRIKQASSSRPVPDVKGQTLN